jgi:proteasome-associated ATPase
MARDDSLGPVSPAEVARLREQNERLSNALRDASAMISQLREDIEKCQQPPSNFGLFIRPNNGLAEISFNGRPALVGVGPGLELDELLAGQLVALNGELLIVGAYGFGDIGELVSFKELLEGDRMLVVSRMDEERVLRMVAPLIGRHFREGDLILADLRDSFALDVVAKAETNSLLLEKVPDIGYDDVGGLAVQIEQIHDAIELPFLHPALYQEHELRPPKGVLLYGPPGCGKTLIAKAIANSLAKRMAKEMGGSGQAFFINIKGPELLTKWVGETERKIREIFANAREKAAEGHVVVIFFDEMESMFRARGSGVSSDMESTVVPQILSEIDGVEGLHNVIVIGASNRQDLIDPALLRPGRLDVKIAVTRPDPEAARDIFGKYLTASLPLHSDELVRSGGSPDRAVARMIDEVVRAMYAETLENQFLEVVYGNASKDILYFKDFASGAMIKNIVDRAKKFAIKAFLETDVRGITLEHLLQAVRDEYKENEDLPNTTNPDDWARISGRKGERIVAIRQVVRPEPGASSAGSRIETVSNTGQYL